MKTNSLTNQYLRYYNTNLQLHFIFDLLYIYVHCVYKLFITGTDDHHNESAIAYRIPP